MTTEAKFIELAVDWINKNPDKLLDTSTFKDYLRSINFPFDKEDLELHIGGAPKWEQKVNNIISHNSMKIPCVLTFRYTEPAPTDSRELAAWTKPKPKYFFVKDDSPLVATLKTIDGVEFLNENLSLPTHLFG